METSESEDSRIPEPPEPGYEVAEPPTQPTPPIKVGLTTTDNGYFKLEWESRSPDSWDYIGLFESTTAGDGNPVTGNNWQRASKGGSYETNSAARPGWQARYLRWSAPMKAYQSIVRTAPFPDRVETGSNIYAIRDWMKYVPDNTSLAAMTLPGTHDTASWGAYVPYVNTQSMPLEQQLRAGIRFLDIRLGLNPTAKGLVCFHGIVPLRLRFTDVMKTVFEFLDAYPTEAVVIAIKNEGPDADEFAIELRDEMVSMNATRFIVTDLISDLVDARGKVVLVRRFVLPATGFKNSIHNEGTRSLTTKAVSIRRQAERGADGERAVGRLGRAVGAGRAAVAEAGASVSLSGEEASA
jgi:hypothetical protein